MNGRRALVTGGAGFIGSHLVDRLLELGYQVSVLDNTSTGKLGNLERHVGKKGFRFVRGSITDADVVRRTLRGIDFVFHHAALLSVTQSVSDPLLIDRVNARGTLILLDAARRAGTKRFIFASSAAVYGSAGAPVLDENSALEPDSPYGASKIAGEAHCRAFFHAYGMETVVLRYFNVYGPRCGLGRYGGAMAQMADRVVRGLPIEIYGDGTQTRDFVYVGDVVRANMVAASSEAASGETFNIGTGIPTTVNELAEMMLSSSLASERVLVIHRSARPGEIFRSVASAKKARRILGYRPTTRLSEGVREFVSWYQEVRGRHRARR